MSARLKQNFLHLALPFGTRGDYVRFVRGGAGSVRSVEQLVRHFSEAGRLDSPQNLRRIVWMDNNRPFPFGNILASSHNYTELAARATNQWSAGEGYPFLTVVRVESDHTPSSKGKPRYLCEAAQGVRPVLVVKTDLAPIVQQMMEWGHETFLIAARPYRKDTPPPVNEAEQIFLYVERLEQIKFITPDHWDAPIMDRKGQLSLAPHMAG